MTLKTGAEASGRSTVRGETGSDRWKRRILSVPSVILALGLMLVASPIWLPLAFFYDLSNRFGSAALRSGVFLTIYLTCEVIGLVASGVFWMLEAAARPGPAARAASFERHFALQRWWAGTLLHAAIRVYRLKLRVDGEEVLVSPMILMLRHASIGDSLLASEFIGGPHGIHLRYIMKRELLIDPCLDIVGHRLPNYFVDRESDDPAEQIDDIRNLLSDLGDREGVLVYPEGTRFTEATRQRLIAQSAQGGRTRVAAQAQALRHTLPPRLGGPLALLDANPGLDVVFCAHVGFDAARSPLDLIGGRLLDQQVAVSFWRVPFDRIPHSFEARSAWLFEQWQAIDEWIDVERSRRASPPAD